MKDYRDVKGLARIVKKEKNKGNVVGFTNGCYDVLHIGHFQILEQTRQFVDFLIVGLNSDSSVRKFKGNNRPINNELNRAYVVSRIKGVDNVIIFDEDTPLNLLEKLKPDFNIKGGASIPERVAKEKQVMGEYGGKIIYLPLVDRYSTSLILEKIENL